MSTEHNTKPINPEPEVIDPNEQSKQQESESNDHSLLKWLDTKQDNIAGYCAEGIDYSMIRRTFATAMARNPDIANCTGPSIILAITNAARLGLDPTGERNSAHFLPYKDNKRGVTELKLTIGYGGLISLMTRNGDVLDITPQVVYQGEEFEVLEGTEQRITHKPDMDIRNADKTNPQHIIAAYAVATLKSGIKKFVTLSRKELEIARNASKQKDGPWKWNFAEMAKKTTVRNMSKWLVLDPIASEGIAISDDGDGYEFSNSTGRNALPQHAGEPEANALRNRIQEMRDAGVKREPVAAEPEPTNPPADEEFARDMAARID
jgi:recombination protein RecT